jgi:hypothetical protein
MQSVSKFGPIAGALLLVGLAGFALIARATEANASTSPLPSELAPPQTQTAPTATAPGRYYYGPGFQGYGYYAVPGYQAAPAAPAQVAAARPSAPRSQTVGPGARNWATGNRVPLHRPWLRSRN